MQGALPRYNLSLDSLDENKLIVTYNKTGNQIQVQQVITRNQPTIKKWKIKTEDGKYRYLDMESLRVANLRQKLRGIPIEELNIRNNVEATIFQLGYHYSNNKCNYRTLGMHRLWAYSRSLWINFVRIMKYVTQICQRTRAWLKLTKFIVNICDIMQIIVFISPAKIIINKNPMIMRFSTF